MLTFEQIVELATLVADKKLEGIEIERSGFRLQVLGRSEPERAPVALAAPAASPAAEAPTSQSGGTAPAAEEDAPSDEVDGHILTSPIVGTFYRAPSPDSEPYVEVGHRVRKGQVLCIVEAMKLMNEIEADADGEVLKIFPQNSQAVEFGEPLFAIRPS